MGFESVESESGFGFGPMPVTYSIWLIRLPLMDPPIEDLFKISLRPLMYMLKSWGDRMLPWRTLLVTLKLSEMQAPHLIVISCF